MSALVPTPLKDLRPGDKACRTPGGPVVTIVRVHTMRHLNVINLTVRFDSGWQCIWGEDRLTRPGGPQTTLLKVATDPPGGDAA